MKELLFLALLLAQPPAKPALYDEKASGAQQIETALIEAKKTKKNVLLQFGAKVRLVP